MSRRVDMIDRWGLSPDECEADIYVDEPVVLACRTCSERTEIVPPICSACLSEVEALVDGEVIEVVPAIVRRRTLEVAA